MIKPVAMPMPLPMDIRLMQWTAGLLSALALLMCMMAGLGWFMRHPIFAIQGISVKGDVVHSNAVTLRANVLPHLSGNFFTLDLTQARLAFEQVPWVRSALVRRQFPNRLSVTLNEFEPVALWGEENDGRLLSKEGAVFEVNTDELDTEQLPLLKGPDGQGPSVLQMYRALRPVFRAVDLDLERLELNQRGGWRAVTDAGASIELGSGHQEEISARLQLFFKTLTQISSRYGRTSTSLLAADLRHENGYALRLRGVSTTGTDGVKTP